MRSLLLHFMTAELGAHAPQTDNSPIPTDCPHSGFAQKVTCWFLDIADSHSPIANV